MDLLVDEDQDLYIRGLASRGLGAVCLKVTVLVLVTAALKTDFIACAPMVCLQFDAHILCW
jgi:hypothetical protein